VTVADRSAFALIVVGWAFFTLTVWWWAGCLAGPAAERVYQALGL